MSPFDYHIRFPTFGRRQQPFPFYHLIPPKSYIDRKNLGGQLPISSQPLTHPPLSEKEPEKPATLCVKAAPTPATPAESPENEAPPPPALREQAVTPPALDQNPVWFTTCSELLERDGFRNLLMLYGFLVGVLAVKNTSSKNGSAYKSNATFIHISVYAIVFSVLAHRVLEIINIKKSNTNDQESSNPPSRLQMILVVLVNVLIIVASVIIVCILVLPPDHMWIGYVLISLTPMAIVACILYVT